MAAINVKLAVDRSCYSVLFADAGSDFVDVLLSFLTFPLAAIQSCSAGAPSPGCLSNLCDSVERLRNSRLLKVEACHGMLLTPAHSDEFKLCKSANSYCNEVFIKGSKCCVAMARLLHVYNQAGIRETFVSGKERFVISDDMTIKPASTSSMHSLAQAFDSDGIGHDFEVVLASVGWQRVLFMLKASLSSDTVLTDAFLSKRTDNLKPIICQKILPSDQDSAGSSPESKTKIFYDTSEKKVVYAECNHGFVDLLLGFLTYPVSCVIKHTGVGTCHLGRFLGSLYRNAIDLDDAGCLTGIIPKMNLLDPSLRPFNILRNVTCRPLDCQCRKDTVPEHTRFCCHPELVEDRKYVVGDALLIHQASAVSLMKHWCGRNKAMVLEMDITIGKPEAIALLRAVLTSKSVLTGVFIDRLEEHFSQKKIQIFARIPKGKTITVEVARVDTIATVKSKIKDKVSFQQDVVMKLVYGSRYLKDSCTVAECNLVRECTVTCEFYKK
ncbi:uncharacterized protein [Triticum aestivum]|uniref:uncharacterized protein n=1 Tax=Triticum aestivum TaxID=4565 RepID=UPI001D025C44|nr:uncharacterized protein LOC123097148 [Triticum aestivum]